jgi:hypothetical protein
LFGGRVIGNVIWEGLEGGGEGEGEGELEVRRVRGTETEDNIETGRIKARGRRSRPRKTYPKHS